MVEPATEDKLYGPVKLRAEIASAVLWLFVTVSNWFALIVLMASDPKARDVALSCTAGTPTAVRATFCGLPAAVSVIVSVALTGPGAVGVTER